MPDSPFDLDLPPDTPLRRAVSIAARPLLGWVVGAHTYGELSRRAEARRGDGAQGPGTTEFVERGAAAYAASALDILDIRVECPAADRAGVSSRGPLIIAANHPHGALDGLVLLDIVGRRRQDVRLIANGVLSRVTGLREFCFFVDPFDRPDSASRSLTGLRSAHLWLRRGGAVIVFPAGEVAHVRQPDGSVGDSTWRSTVGRLAIATGAAVLPVHIAGANSRLFYAAGRIHPLLRTVLLPRELLKSRGCSVRVSVGHPFTASELKSQHGGAAAATLRIRHSVEQLGAVRQTSATGHTHPAAVEGPQDARALAREVSRLPDSARLVEAEPLHVFCTASERIPAVLREIGRLRELTYRGIGEGTGRPSDLDRFDEHYLHLFVWNARHSEVVGAYRIGRTDLIVSAGGVQGLYTRTLFRYDAALLRRLPPALELGRSFVRSEYQRTHSALMLLWKGICALVARHPQYRVLFGAVSISDRYSERTREMLVRFLEQNHREDSLASMVSSLHPYSPGRPATFEMPSRIPRSIEEADGLVAELERQPGGMPVLLRQYLKLNAQLLGFNVDPQFGNALDALMMVDLTRVDRRILCRYFGPAAARAYLDLASVPSASDAASRSVMPTVGAGFRRPKAG
jgi:putative hemolysin